MKNCIRTLWGCKQSMQPVEVAKRVVLKGYMGEEGVGIGHRQNIVYDTLPQHIKRQLFVVIINQMMLRLNLSPALATVIGTVSRLSSSIDGLVSTTISNQGTFMEATPIQNTIIDCLSQLKLYASRFYDVLPKQSMLDFYKRSDPSSVGIRDSLYDMEIDLNSYFNSYYRNGVKYEPLVATVNETMTLIHKSLVANVAETILPEKFLKDGNDAARFNTMQEVNTTLLDYSCGANSIISAIMPTHYEPLTFTSASLLKPGVQSTEYGAMLHTFVNSLSNPAAAQNCQPRLVCDPQVIQIENFSILDDLSNGRYINALIPALNYGIRGILTSFYDYGQRKIYKGILEMFMDSRLSLNIENLSLSYPDVVAPDNIRDGEMKRGNGYIHFGLPNKDSLLVFFLFVFSYVLYILQLLKELSQQHLPMILSLRLRM